MIWRQEAYRSVLQSGNVDMGAVYPPVGRGRVWRWRALVTSGGHPSVGRALSEPLAKQQVEKRFKAFLDAAQLVQIGGGL